MAALRYSALAENDLVEIAKFTRQTWGDAQAEIYLNGLVACCELLAQSPQIGRACGEVRLGLRRMTQTSHVIFLEVREPGILVVRILHKSMLPTRNLG